MDAGARNTLIGNTSSFNSTGFTTSSEDDLRFIGNWAEGNINGFNTYDDRRAEYLGNTAQQNTGAGFVIVYGERLTVQENIARANGDDGFRIDAGSFQTQELTDNYAINNGGHGLHVLTQWGPMTRLVGNTALGHTAPFFDLADDNPRCRKTMWRDNTFASKSQDCIK
jgi:parallel beta-helix repeat protein